MRIITDEKIAEFKRYLSEEEKAEATVEKYVRDISAFTRWLCGRNVEKAVALEYKQRLMEAYAPASVNSILSSLNNFFVFNEWFSCRVKTLKIQRQMFLSQDKELTKAEYDRLLSAAKNEENWRLYLLMQTICSTGIRISELRFVSAEAVRWGRAVINCKGKVRQVILPKKLCKMLLKYLKENNIKSGHVFRTKTGKPLDRINVWRMLKKLCDKANVPKSKVFPHNFRHLFARTYYSIEKDISRLADILGHSNVNTTRIYTMESGRIHRMQIQKLGLLRC